MRLALRQARRASGRTFPNPAVGAIVYRGDRVLGRGHTRPPGGPHAEICALDTVRRREGPDALRGASLAVTLEPCSHVGRTGPCTEAILAAGIGRVFVGQGDPHPQVRGAGLRRLRRAGIPVSVGVLAAACREQHRGFVSTVTRGRPFVCLKLACSLDGRIATATGEARWITGTAARAYVHRLRSRCDAILIGSGTALADDPELTARRGERVVHRPVRLLVDTALRVSTGARIYSDGYAQRTWVLCSEGAPRQRRAAVERTGARLLPLPQRDDGVAMEPALTRLATEGIGEVLCEGGGRLAAALLRARRVDELHWLVAPKLLGGDARPALGNLHLQRLADAPELVWRRARRLGPDWLFTAEAQVGEAP